MLSENSCEKRIFEIKVRLHHVVLAVVAAGCDVLGRLAVCKTERLALGHGVTLSA